MDLPEAAVFHPTPEEFRNPLLYISSIRPYAQHYGIVRIVPPSDWKPSFALDDSLVFTPRCQTLCELSASSRMRQEFHHRLATFWDLKGTPIQTLPRVGRRPIDLYRLSQAVTNAQVDQQVDWKKVADEFQLQTKTAPEQLQACFEEYLQPFLEQTTDAEDHLDSAPKVVNAAWPTDQPDKGAASYSHDSSYEDQHRNLAKRRKLDDGTGETNQKRRKTTVLPSGRRRPAVTRETFTAPEDVCHTCGYGDRPSLLLICDSCDAVHHTFCVEPPLPEVPSGKWHCPDCVVSLWSRQKQSLAYGFRQAPYKYTLSQFQQTAERWHHRRRYRDMSINELEQEFWRLVSDLSADRVTVEYGADLPVAKHGSGFKLDQDSHYSGWYLPLLPKQALSLPRHLKQDISGVNVPWLYAGMLFSSFCWHVEDHFTYSINYVHMGRPKLWYGVPSRDAERFEQVSKQLAPELFEENPDLLHHLVLDYSIVDIYLVSCMLSNV